MSQRKQRAPEFKAKVALDLDIEIMNDVQFIAGQMSGSCGAAIVDLLSLRSRANRYQKNLLVSGLQEWHRTGSVGGVTARVLAVCLK